MFLVSIQVWRPARTLNFNSYLILEEKSTKCPNSREDKIEFVDVLSGVWGCVLGSQEGLEQVAQGLDHADLGNNNNNNDVESIF